jgi:uncharacterized Zn finger protein
MMSYGYYGRGWKPYVSVAQRRAKATRHVAKLAKQGRKVLPVEIAGRKIAATFWGTAWCENLESYSDFENRLPRGRTYVRNGSVVDLQIKRGCVTAMVSGSEIYEIKIDIAPLNKACWKNIKGDCARSIDSLIDLLQGRFSKGVMERLTRQDGGLFPKPKEISVRCSCPDWAVLCKHAAAALYGVGARLDSAPEMLFLLRGVDHLELISQAVDGANLDAAFAPGPTGALAGEDLGELFGIDMETPDQTPPTPPVPRARRAKALRSKPAIKKAVNAKRSKPRQGVASSGVLRKVKKKVGLQQKANANPKRRQKIAKPKTRKKK